MKILDSKFYRPLSNIDIEYNAWKNSIITKKWWFGRWLTSNSPYSDLLYSMLANWLYYNSWICIKQKYLKDFEKCDDFVSFKYSKTFNKIIDNESCYFHKKYEIFIVITEDLSNDSDKEIFDKWNFRVIDFFYDNTDLNHQKNIWKFFEKYLEKYISKDGKISLLVRNWDNVELNEYKISPQKIDFKTMYNNDFLPVSEHIVEKLKKESKWIVLLHWEPWTWKTNYIKWLTAEISEKKFIFVPTTMISSLSEPYFINFLIENKNSVLIFEDCENYISERNSYNSYTDVVASILNLADGILSDVVECQIICTFNASIDKIDSALLRKWRLIAEYCFKELEIEKLEKYFKSEKIDYKVNKKMTLSEAINLENKSFKEKEKQKKKVGFDLD